LWKTVISTLTLFLLKKRISGEQMNNLQHSATSCILEEALKIL
jgi:hypothetical protein